MVDSLPGISDASHHHFPINIIRKLFGDARRERAVINIVLAHEGFHAVTVESTGNQNSFVGFFENALHFLEKEIFAVGCGAVKIK